MRLVVACLILIAANAGTYLFMQWLPTILLAAQIDLSNSLIYNLVIVSGTLLAGIAGGLIGDRVGRRKMKIISSILGFCSAASLMWLKNYSQDLGMGAGFLDRKRVGEGRRV